MSRQNQDLHSDLMRFSTWIQGWPITSLEWLRHYRESFAGLLKTILYQGGYHQWGVTRSVAIDYERKVFSALNWLSSISNLDFSCDQEKWDISINGMSVKDFLQEIWINIDFVFDASIWFNGSALIESKTIVLNPILINNKSDLYIFALFHEIGHIVDPNQKGINFEKEIYILQKEIESKKNAYKSSEWVDGKYREYVSKSKEWRYDSLMREYSDSEVNANMLWLQLFKSFCDKCNIWISDLGRFFGEGEHTLNMFLNSYIPIDPYSCNENWLFLLKSEKYQEALMK